MNESRQSREEVPNITDAEWEVMKTLWEHGPLAARDIYAGLPSGHGWAYNTVKTMIARLVTKGAIAYEQVGNSYLYRAALSRERVTRRELRGFIDRVLGGSLMPMLSHYVEEHDLSDEEVAQLRKLLENKQDPPKKGRKGRKS